MKAVILAAGEGTRIKLKIPKPLVRIDGLSLLERTILTFADLKELSSLDQDPIRRTTTTLWNKKTLPTLEQSLDT